MKKTATVFWILTVCIMIIIFFFSSQTAVESTKVSYGLTERIIDFVAKITSIPKETAEKFAGSVESLIRSLAHFSVFSLLGITSFIATYNTAKIPGTRKSLYSLPICFVYAISDEIHQIFVPGRTFQVSDILTDFAGVITGTFIVIAVIWLKKRKWAN